MAVKELLKEGDIVYTNCTNMQLCRHIGIVYQRGEVLRVFHNDPENQNRYGGNITSESFENFIKHRQVLKVVRSNAKNEDILRVARRCKTEQWNTMLFNCEDFVLEITENHRRSVVRDAFKVAALGVVMISSL